MKMERKLVPLDPFVCRLLLILTIVATTATILAIVVYEGPFLVWKYALSDLGAVRTKYNAVNTASRLVFIWGFAVSSYIMARVGFHYLKHDHLTWNKPKGVLSLLASLGFLIFLYPHDMNKQIHTLGAGLMVGSCYLFANVILFEMRSGMDKWRWVYYQGILHVSVLSYATAYILHWAIRQIPQKFCFLGIIYIFDQISLRNLEEESLLTILGIERV